MKQYPLLPSLRPPADYLSAPVITMASPLVAFLKVPLDWYHTRLYPRHADETEHMIRRRYMHGPDAQRIFCGFCGTPLTHWSPEGQNESDYISVTLGSLDNEDIHDLESMGLVPTLEGDTSPEKADTRVAASGKDTPATLDDAMELFMREFSEVPWFDALVDGSILGKLTKKNKRKPGKLALQWEVIEFPGEGSEASERSAHPGKRTFEQFEEA